MRRYAVPALGAFLLLLVVLMRRPEAHVPAAPAAPASRPPLRATETAAAPFVEPQAPVRPADKEETKTPAAEPKPAATTLATVPLKRLDAGRTAERLVQLYTGLTATADARTNSLHLQGEDHVLSAVRDYLTAADR